MRITVSFDTLASRRVILFGGKGGAGKTTISSLAALHYARTRKVILFTTDPASNLADLFGEGSSVLPNLSIESVDGPSLYARFLEENLSSLLEIGDRGTYLDREELSRFFELSLPGIDEVMAWMRIGELAEENPDSIIVVDTAPTGHALRMLGGAAHFQLFGSALDAMQAKHRAMVRQMTRRDVRDAIDGFIEEFQGTARKRRELLNDPVRTAFVPVMLSEPWVVDQTIRLADEVRQAGLDVPFVVLNRAVEAADCARCEKRWQADQTAVERLAPLEVVKAPRSCVPIDAVPDLERYLQTGAPA